MTVKALLSSVLIITGLAPSPLLASGSDQPTFSYSFGQGDEIERIVRLDTAEIVEYTSGVYGRILSRNSEPFSYDRSGRRTEDDRFSYAWNWRGELQSVTVKNAPPGSAEFSGYAGHRVTYSYDASGRLHYREHRGEIPAGGTEASRPFIELREFVWDGHGLSAEVAFGSPDQTQPRWRRTYVPGPSGLDDAVQALVEVDSSFPASPYAGQSKLYTYIRDEIGNVVALVAENEPPSAQEVPPLTVRYLYTPYGESHAEIGPELRLARFESDLTSVAGVEQQATEPRSAASGAILLQWSLPVDVTTLTGGILAERLDPGVGWEALPNTTVATTGSGDQTTVAVLPTAGWPRQSTYRIRITSSLRDVVGRRFGATHRLEWSIPAAPADGPVPAVVYQQAFPVRFDSSQAASETAGGRFPGGQAALFNGAWTDPVSGLSYHRARWYDARNLSFLTEDPAGPVDSPNLYAFTSWQPHMATDPTGECVGKAQQSRFCQAIARGIAYLIAGTPEAQQEAERQEFFLAQKLAFTETHNRRPQPEDVIFELNGGAQLLYGNGTWVDASGTAIGGPLETFALTVAVPAGRAATLAAGAARAAGGNAAKAATLSLLDDAAGEVIGVNPSLGGALVNRLRRPSPALVGDSFSPGSVWQRQIDFQGQYVDWSNTSVQTLGRSADSGILAGNLQALGVMRPDYGAAHHLVAGLDKRAAQARSILAREGVDINEAANGVYLPRSGNVAQAPVLTHSTIHTDLYYQELTRRLAATLPGTVRDTLRQVASEVAAGTFPK